MERSSKRAVKTQETKERIMAAADSLFKSHGFESITFRSLAAESGISFGSIQHHFGTKDNLMFIYGCREFEKYMQANYVPVPSDPSLNVQADLIRRMDGVFAAYADFALTVGKEFMLEASKNGHDIFREVCNEKYLKPFFDEAFTNRVFDTPDANRHMFEEDILIICRSIVLLWSSSGDSWDFSGDLKAVLTRVIRHFLRVRDRN